jgi:hypothetical protein
MEKPTIKMTVTVNLAESNSSDNEDHHQFNIGRFCARRAELFTW